MNDAQTREETGKLIPLEVKNKIIAAIEWTRNIRELVVTTDEQQESAALELAKAKKWLKEFEERKKEITRPWKEKAGLVDAAFKKVADSLNNAIRIIDSAVVARQMEVERIAREKQAKLDAAAEAERKRMQEKADAEMAKAEKYREEGREEMAQKAEARAEVAVETSTAVVAAQVEVVKPSAANFVTTYTATVVDKLEAIVSCCENPVLESVVSINTTKLERIIAQCEGKIVIKGVNIVIGRRTRTKTGALNAKTDEI